MKLYRQGAYLLRGEEIILDGKVRGSVSDTSNGE